VLIFLALFPAATALLIYTFVGAFFPVYMLAAAAAAVIAAGLQWHAG
jgi:Na+/H+ antiporter NhaC